MRKSAWHRLSGKKLGNQNKCKSMSETERTPIRSDDTPICGGADSERHVHPCGRRPRPTGRDCELSSLGFDALENDLLAGLGKADLQSISPHLQSMHLRQGHLLVEAGDEVDHVYFPVAGMISL